MFNTPFRKEAVASRSQRQQLDHLLRITAPHERYILGGIGLVLLAFGAWALFGSIVRSITLEGVVIEPGARHEVISTEPGYVVEFLVAPGDRVAAGDAIARQSVPELDRETAALRDRVELLQAEIGQVGADGGTLRPLLAAARVALLQMESRRSAREQIASQIGGEVMALHVAAGDYLPAGAAVVQLRDADDRPPRAVLRVAPRTAQRIRPGMQASIEVVTSDGATSALHGEVDSVTAGPPPGWRAATRPAAADSLSRIDVVLRRTPDYSVPDGTPCRVRIVLGRHPPVALFDLGHS